MSRRCFTYSPAYTRLTGCSYSGAVSAYARIAPTEHKNTNYGEYMSSANVDIDDKACDEVMRRYQLATKREAINFALRTLAAT